MSPGSMESTAAFRVVWSSVTSLITCTREPKASTWARCPTRSPPIDGFGGRFGLREPVAGAHAERIVDGQHGDLAGALGGEHGLPHVGMGEGQHEQQYQQGTRGEQQQVAQAAVLDGTLRPLLEEHQRTERQRRGLVFAQQVQPDRQPDGEPRPPETMA